MFGDVIKNGVRLFFTFWFYQIWGVAIALVMGYFVWSMIVEAFRSTL